MADRRLRVLVGLLGVLWLTVAISLYGVYHKPFTLELAANLVRASRQVGVALAIVAVAGGLGRRLLPLMDLLPLARAALQAALGLGLLGLALLALGVSLGWSPTLLGALLVLLGVVLRHTVLGWCIAWRDLWRLLRESDPLGHGIAAGVALILLCTLLVALAPPLKFDALVYHLPLPHAYLAAGRLVYLPENIYWGMPQQTEMLYTWAVALGGDPAAAALGWMIGVLALAGLLGYAEQVLGLRSAWVAVAALLSGFTLAASLAWAYVDWTTILLGWAFLVTLEGWLWQGHSWHLLLAGLFAGLALGTKYTAGTLCLLGTVAILQQGAQHGRALWTNLFRFVAMAFLTSCPWWVKNLMATGNPAYPFFFPAGAMTRLRLELYQGYPVWGDWWEALLLPLRATFMGVEGAAGYNASIGPLLLALGALAWVGWSDGSRRQQAALRCAAMLALGGLLVWAISSRASGYLVQSRLHLTVFPAAAILAGAGFAGLGRQVWPGVRLRRVAGLLVMLAFYFNVFQVGVTTLTQGALLHLLGLCSSPAYLTDNLGWHYSAMQAVGDLPAGARVLMLWEPRSLYCQPRCIPDEVLDRWPNDLYRWKTPETVLAVWRGAGYSHLLVYRAGADFLRSADSRYQPADWEALEALLSELPPPVNFGGAYELYALRR